MNPTCRSTTRRIRCHFHDGRAVLVFRPDSCPGVELHVCARHFEQYVAFVGYLNLAGVRFRRGSIGFHH